VRRGEGSKQYKTGAERTAAWRRNWELFIVRLRAEREREKKEQAILAEQKEQIQAALRAGKSVRQCADRFGLSDCTVRRCLMDMEAANDGYSRGPTSPLRIERKRIRERIYKRERAEQRRGVVVTKTKRARK